ncbi:MAG: glycoside hydrolase family 25 protein [Bacteroidales bacterium]|nr:glycoside hydrolase family 25 protein [Bacteroidales bacterium]
MRKPVAVIIVMLLLLPVSLNAQKGIDVSRFQDSINWKRVAKNSNIEFVYVKATEGASISDPMYKYNIKKAKDAGLLVGSYHVYSSRTTAYQQFANFKKTLGKTKQDLVPVLDIEALHCNKLYMKRVDKLLELMEKEYGAKPMIYTSEKLYKTHFDTKKYKKYHFFIANYKREPSMAYTLWQYTQRGKLKGIAGFVDFSKFSRKYSVDSIKIKKKGAEMKQNADSAAASRKGASATPAANSAKE